MPWLGVTYTRRFNNRHGRSGHFFQSRFKSIIVETDAYLMTLSCYIHRNPLRAGIVSRFIGRLFGKMDDQSRQCGKLD